MNSTREGLQRVATHVLARARFVATGKFGLRATPGGFGTPPFGPDIEVIRVAGPVLHRERGARLASCPLAGASLEQLAAFVEVDLSAPFHVGHDTPRLGDARAPLQFETNEVGVLADWFHLGWRVLDTAIASERDPATIQLWPEHFDAGTSVAVGRGDDDRCNLGASPGDDFNDEPYLYVAPWTSGRPGAASFWNAPFGAVLTRSALLQADDPIAAGASFVHRGLQLLKG